MFGIGRQCLYNLSNFKLTFLFSLCSPKIALKHSTPGIGLGCLYLALRTCKADFSLTMNEYVDMWGASQNISVQAVRDVVTDLLDLYENFPFDNLKDIPITNSKLPVKK